MQTDIKRERWNYVQGRAIADGGRGHRGDPARLGCPVQAIVHAFSLDERTVASWRDRAGAHCEQVHRALIETGKLDLVHVQADEIRVKGRTIIAWMGLAMMVSTRLWLAGRRVDATSTPIGSVSSPPTRFDR